MVARYTGQWARTRFLAQEPTPPESTQSWRIPDPGHGSFSETSVPVLMDSPEIPQPVDTVFDDVQYEDYTHPSPASVYQPRSYTGPKAKNAEETGHGFGGPRGPVLDKNGYYDVHIANQVLSAARGNDRGAAKQYSSEQQSYGPHGLKSHEQPMHIASPSMLETPHGNDDSGGSYAWLRRGLSSDRINRGMAGRSDYWRQRQDLGPGQSVGGPPGNWSVADKPSAFRADRMQRDFYDARFVQGQLKYAASRTVSPQVNIPPPDKQNRYTSPFGSLQRFIPHYNLPLSGIRRQPTPWYEDKLAEFTPVEANNAIIGEMVVP